MATLYEFNMPGQSTINPNVAEYKESETKSFKKGETIVPQMSMKQLCERFITKKVNFFNLDIEGMGPTVLQTNNWDNPLCVPEFILAEDNILN